MSRTIPVALRLALAVALAVALAGCRGPRSSTEQTISQLGSTTALPLAQEWRKAYNAAHPEVDIAVSGGGSGTGIKALISGTAQIANASREIKAEEIEQAKAAGVDPVEHVVAYDGIAVIVHPSNPIALLSVEQVSDLFAGKATDWGDVTAKGLGEVQLISRDSASGTYEAFKELVVTLGGADKSRDYAPQALKQASNQAILTMVAQTKTAIGYVGLGYLDESVKALDIVPLGGEKAVAPAPGSVLDGTYPISRPLYCYTNGEPTGVLKEYLDWIKGPEGQGIVERLGFVPASGEAAERPGSER